MERSEEFYESLDPLIAPYVRILNRGGIETIESCQCTEGHMASDGRMPDGPHSWPWFRFIGGAGAGFKAAGIALECGWPVTRVYRQWNVMDCASGRGVVVPQVRAVQQPPSRIRRAHLAHWRLPPLPGRLFSGLMFRPETQLVHS